MTSLPKIKLLHIQLLPLLSGVQNMMLKLLSELDKERYEIYVICKPGGPLVNEIRRQGYHFLPLNSLRREISFLDIIAFFQIIFLCRKHQFDIVHTHSSKTGFVGRIAARLAGVKKIIHTVHGFSFHEFQAKPVQAFYILLETFAALFCDKVVFVNHSERKMAIEKKIVSPKKCITIVNGIEIPSRQKKINCAAWDKDIIVGSVGRFCKQKNSISMVQTAIQTVQKEKRFRFVFIGDGELLGTCKHLVKHAKLENRILFPGWIDDVENWLYGFDVFFLFSKWEGLPISILEAMAVGLPVVASDIKGNNELVSNMTGELLPISMVDKLPALFFRLLNNCKEWKNKGNMARNMVIENYNIVDFGKRYQEIYVD